ncbi:hypothetical protein [Thermococcus gorgonarius]|uniref:Uncharacterized protein n=1 Tax=Thermococcus gorgonarius TaxID=71997 RepID=A0A2Z2M5P5_THEGO|nr:hypothetical protein [Thermococcus gorgonarius]ASJ01540.1 hypothetical protein A3K92_08635 [Thermococcus gorgonarius]
MVELDECVVVVIDWELEPVVEVVLVEVFEPLRQPLTRTTRTRRNARGPFLIRIPQEKLNPLKYKRVLRDD